MLAAAVALADRDGLDALTMRRLAQDLEVEAMSLYHHVANKEALLDGVVEVVVEEIVAATDVAGGPATGDDWRAGLRARILSAREVLLRHPWAPRVLETRTTLSPAVIGYYDGVLGILRAGGFSYDLAHHALHVLGSRTLGFVQELFEPDDPAGADADVTAMLEQLGGRFPHIVGMMAEVAHATEGTLGWCDDQFEFEFALDLILDGLEARRVGDRPRSDAPGNLDDRTT
ncbi:MAG: TetR/AcrR family transcriptional regulator [Actinobacteria bacterium]|nr:TetR/AcrR family transcriptional regulator [Actinomycetota bacterium]